MQNTCWCLLTDPGIGESNFHLLKFLVRNIASELDYCAVDFLSCFGFLVSSDNVFVRKLQFLNLDLSFCLFIYSLRKLF